MVVGGGEDDVAAPDEALGEGEPVVLCWASDTDQQKKQSTLFFLLRFDSVDCRIVIVWSNSSSCDQPIASITISAFTAGWLNIGIFISFFIRGVVMFKGLKIQQLLLIVYLYRGNLKQIVIQFQLTFRSSL